MGIYDRDYYRQDASGSDFLSGPGAMTRRIVVVTVVAYVVQLLWQSGNGDAVFTDLIVLDRNLLSGQVWRLVTYAFAHSPSIYHILWNMYFLWVMGPDLEQIYGPREFLRFYLTAAVFSALCYVGLSLAISGGGPGFLAGKMMGASGSVSSVLVVMAMFYPTRQMLFLFIIPIEIRWIVFLNLVFDLHPILLELGGGQVQDGIAHGAHLGGMLFGFLYKRYDLQWSKLLAGWSWKRVRRTVSATRSNVKLYQPPEDASNLNDKVDAILGKISREGEASLTDAERETLKEASKRYKDRR
jgi:membrane associated rhomboid family serine protease